MLPPESKDMGMTVNSIAVADVLSFGWDTSSVFPIVSTKCIGEANQKWSFASGNNL